MYKLPKGFDGTFLVGRTLESVSFTQNTVFLEFDGKVLITILSSWEHRLTPHDNTPAVQRVPVSQSRLMRLVAHVVTQVSGDEGGTLCVVFDNGHVLRVFDDLPNYESYLLRIGDREIVV